MATIKNKLSNGTYRTWHSMMQRCYYPKSASFNSYGLKGIKVCKRWHDFENFVSDMGIRPEGMTLDRKDSTKNYTKLNCQWLEARKNCAKKGRYLDFRGEKKTLTELSREFDISQSRLYHRVFISGWDLEKAVTTKARKYGNN